MNTVPGLPVLVAGMAADLVSPTTQYQRLHEAELMAIADGRTTVLPTCRLQILEQAEAELARRNSQAVRVLAWWMIATRGDGRVIRHGPYEGEPALHALDFAGDPTNKCRIELAYAVTPGWHAVGRMLPPLGQIVLLHEPGQGTYFGARTAGDAGEGWLWARCHSLPWHDGTTWRGDVHQDADYRPTQWSPLSEPPQPR